MPDLRQKFWTDSDDPAGSGRHAYMALDRVTGLHGGR